MTTPDPIAEARKALAPSDLDDIERHLASTAAVDGFSFDVDGTRLRLARTSLRHREDGDLCYPVGRTLLLALLARAREADRLAEELGRVEGERDEALLYKASMRTALVDIMDDAAVLIPQAPRRLWGGLAGIYYVAQNATQGGDPDNLPLPDKNAGLPDEEADALRSRLAHLEQSLLCERGEWAPEGWAFGRYAWAKRVGASGLIEVRRDRIGRWIAEACMWDVAVLGDPPFETLSAPTALAAITEAEGAIGNGGDRG